MTFEILYFISGLAAGGLAVFFALNTKKRLESAPDFIHLKAKKDFLEKEMEQKRIEAEKRERHLISETEQKTRDIFEMQGAFSRLQTEKSIMEKALTEREKDFEETKEKLKLEFKNLAQNILEQKAAIYKTRSQESLSAILQPFEAKIKDFQKQVADCYDKEDRQRHSLSAEIKKLGQAHQSALSAQENLTQALKGSAKVQGDWGEAVLERILESSGLRKNEEFILQGKGLQLKTDEGERLKPDVVIRLPEKRHIVIDSKVSLIHYHEYIKAEKKEDKERRLEQIIHSLSQHINNLSEKSYFVSDQLISPDFTFMFIPLEGVFSLALQTKQSLFEKAWGKSVVIVTPATLLAALRTVASVWKMERQNKNALRIAAESGKMYDKLAGFVSDMKNIGKGLSMAEKSYAEAFKKLSYGKGHLIGKAEKIKQLGASSTKDLSAEFSPVESSPGNP